MAEARLGGNDSFSPLDDEPMPESVSRSVTASSYGHTTKTSDGRRPKSVAFSLSLKDPLSGFSLWILPRARLSARSLYQRVPKKELSGRSLLSYRGAKGEMQALRRNLRI